MSDKIVFRMSAIGRCPKSLSAKLLNYEAEPIPEYLKSSAEEGKWHELRIIDELANAGWTVTDCQQELTIELPTFILVGHFEGKITPQNKKALEYLPEFLRDSIQVGETIMLEVKSKSSFEFNRWMKGRFDEFSDHADQHTCYFKASNLQKSLFITKNRDSGYKDFMVLQAKNFISRFDTITNRLALIVNLANKNKLYEMEFDSDRLECKRCQFKKLCIPHEIPRDAVTDANLRRAVAMIRQGKELEQSGKDLYDEGKAILKQHTYAIGKKKWEFEQVIISLIQVKDTVTYPKEAIEEKVPENILKEIAVAKPGYEYLKIVDLEKNNERD